MKISRLKGEVTTFLYCYLYNLSLPPGDAVATAKGLAGAKNTSAPLDPGDRRSASYDRRHDT